MRWRNHRFHRLRSAIELAVLLAATSAILAAVARAADDTHSIESKCLSNIRQVTRDFVRAGEGYFSPDMKTIVYQAITKDYPFYQIHAQPVIGGSPTLVSTGRGRTTCAYFRPDGKKVIFSSSHLDPALAETEAAERRRLADEARTGQRRRYAWDFDPHLDIFEADLDGRNLKRLTTAPGYDAEGSYSPDGRLIVFCSMRDGGDPEIYLMNADGTNQHRLTRTPGYDGGPFISPDGQWVVFRSDRKKKDFLQIHAIRIDGKDDVALTDNQGVNWGPYWYPSGPYVIWAGADHANPKVRPNYDLWLMKYKMVDGRLAQGPTWRITDHPAADVLPVFSPDGKRLTWTSNRTADHSSQIWIADFKLPE
jgi:TolB protein